MANNKLIVSVYDYTGNWAKPYIDAGYAVILWDYKVEGCILERFGTFLEKIYEAIDAGYQPHGVLFAPPCTDITSAAAWTWPAKDKPGTGKMPFDSITDESTALAAICLHIVDLFPWNFWVMENPPGRMETLVPEFKPYRKMMFQPWEYGDPVTKRTVLWGEFNHLLERTIVKPETVTIKAKDHYYQASSMWAKTGGKSEKTKALRSVTPMGFARAFFAANQ